MGLELALETSRRESTVALATPAGILEAELGEKAHASELLPCVEELLGRAGIERRGGRLALARLFVGQGPGSYTGLRVGIATALGLARATGAALHGLSSFEALAWAELAEGEEGTIALDARAGRFYHARYRRERTGLVTMSPPAAVPAAELARRLETVRILLGHAGLLEAAGIGLGPEVRVLEGVRPRASALLALGRARLADGSLQAVRSLEPLYLAEFGAGAGTPAGGPPTGR